MTTFAPRPRFAHASEREFARLLDFYQIQWLYEPHTFVLRATPDGKPLECFSPDFYLPEFGLYVELTTLKQRLVTKKNRKLRQLRELHPDVNVKLFYARDLHNLMAKYGLARLLSVSSPDEGSADESAMATELDDPVPAPAR
ncbi:MAG: hypothetical protein HYY04_11350 [Chloroflexi bacterium]|nr:hypothetical protein [Chloroflexota bacterium]